MGLVDRYTSPLHRPELWQWTTTFPTRSSPSNGSRWGMYARSPHSNPSSGPLGRMYARSPQSRPSNVPRRWICASARAVTMDDHVFYPLKAYSMDLGGQCTPVPPTQGLAAGPVGECTPVPPSQGLAMGPEGECTPVLPSQALAMGPEGKCTPVLPSQALAMGLEGECTPVPPSQALAMGPVDGYTLPLHPL